MMGNLGRLNNHQTCQQLQLPAKVLEYTCNEDDDGVSDSLMLARMLCT